jgi:uncharacterized membrane protein
MDNSGFEGSGEARLKAVEARLERLEKFLGQGQQAAAAAAVAAPAVPRPAPPPPPLPPSLPLPPPYIAPQQRPRAGNWLGAVAVICFVLAAGFIIKLSLDSGWLTPTRQIGLALMLGFGLVAAGLALLDADRDYASLLPAAGVIVLYAAVFAAHRFYSLLPFESAIAVSAMVSGLCVWLYTRIRSDIYPVAAAAGSYCAPLVLHLGAGSEFSVYYYLLCSVGFAVLSIWVRSRTLTMVSAYLAMLMTAFTGLALKQDALTATMLALNFGVLSAGVYFYSAQNEAPLTEAESLGLMPVLLFFYAMEYYFIDRLAPGLAPWLSLGFAGLLLGLYLAAKKRFPGQALGSESLVMAFITVVLFHSFYLELLPRDARPWLFGVIMLALCAPALTLGRAGRSGPLRLPALGVLAVLALEFISMASHLFSGHDGQWLAAAFFSVLAMWALISYKGEELAGTSGYGPLLGAAHLLAVLGLYRLTKEAGSLYVSASWLVYAGAVIGYAFARRDGALARSAVFVLAFAAGKALLYDAAAAPTVVRIVCLLLTGAALYGSGFFLRKISGWKDEAAS